MHVGNVTRKAVHIDRTAGELDDENMEIDFDNNSLVIAHDLYTRETQILLACTCASEQILGRRDVDQGHLAISILQQP